MKKLISLIMAFICTFALVGCFPENTVNIEFPFEPEDVAFIEIHHSSASLYAEDVVFKSQESITALYRQLESISYKEKDSLSILSGEFVLLIIVLSDFNVLLISFLPKII